MKLPLIFLICFVSVTWQQNPYWAYPNGHLQFYSNFGSEIQNNYPIIASNPLSRDYSVMNVSNYNFQHFLRVLVASGCEFYRIYLTHRITAKFQPSVRLRDPWETIMFIRNRKMLDFLDWDMRGLITWPALSWTPFILQSRSLVQALHS